MREAARGATRFHELRKRGHLLQVTRAERIRQLTQLFTQRLCAALAPRAERVLRDDRFWRRSFSRPDGASHRRQTVRAQPGLHEHAQALAAERKPALALGA